MIRDGVAEALPVDWGIQKQGVLDREADIQIKVAQIDM